MGLTITTTASMNHISEMILAYQIPDSIGLAKELPYTTVLVSMVLIPTTTVLTDPA
jgi:hypothetical protein